MVQLNECLRVFKNNCQDRGQTVPSLQCLKIKFHKKENISKYNMYTSLNTTTYVSNILIGPLLPM